MRKLLAIVSALLVFGGSANGQGPFASPQSPPPAPFKSQPPLPSKAPAFQAPPAPSPQSSFAAPAPAPGYAAQYEATYAETQPTQTVVVYRTTPRVRYETSTTYAAEAAPAPCQQGFAAQAPDYGQTVMLAAGPGFGNCNNNAGFGNGFRGGYGGNFNQGFRDNSFAGTGGNITINARRFKKSFNGGNVPANANITINARRFKKAFN